MGLKGKWRGNGGHQFGSQIRSLLRTVEASGHHHKFITTEARDDIRAAQASVNTNGDWVAASAASATMGSKMKNSANPKIICCSLCNGMARME